MRFEIMRTDGMHTDADGDKHWYMNGERHREDGPAIEYADGDKYWYLNDNKVKMEDVLTKEQQFWWKLK